MVTHVEGPLAFWAQLVDDTRSQDLMTLSDNLQMLCSGASLVSGLPQANKVPPFEHLFTYKEEFCIVKTIL